MQSSRHRRNRLSLEGKNNPTKITTRKMVVIASTERTPTRNVLITHGVTLTCIRKTPSVRASYQKTAQTDYHDEAA